MNDIEKEIILLIQNGVFQPENYLDNTIIFLREKYNLQKLIDDFEYNISHDISNSDISSEEIFNITEKIKKISIDIIRITDLLIKIMPLDTEDIWMIWESEIFIDFIVYENAWLIWINRDIMQNLETWIITHLLEVKKEKKSLQKIINSIQSEDIQLLINHSNFLFNQRLDRLLYNTSL